MHQPSHVVQAASSASDACTVVGAATAKQPSGKGKKRKGAPAKQGLGSSEDATGPMHAAAVHSMQSSTFTANSNHRCLLLLIPVC